MSLVLHLALKCANYPVLHVRAEMEAVAQPAAQPYPVCSGSAPDHWDHPLPRSGETLGRYAWLY